MRSDYYLQKNSGGLELPSISLLYKNTNALEQQFFLLTTRDPSQHVATIELKREDQLNWPKIKPMTLMCNVMTEDPGVSK